MRALERLLDLIDRLFGRGASDFGTRACAEALRDLRAQLDAMPGRRLLERLRVGVGDEELDALHIGADHVRDRVAARAADADHRDLGRQLIDVRRKKFDAHSIISPGAAIALERHPLTL